MPKKPEKTMGQAASASTQPESAAPLDREAERAELARLLGQLLARQWLRQQAQRPDIAEPCPGDVP